MDRCTFFSDAATVRLGIIPASNNSIDCYFIFYFQIDVSGFLALRDNGDDYTVF